MSLFLITFLSLYGGMHAYVFLRLCAAFSPGRTTRAVLASLMALMTVAPLLVRLSEGAALFRTAAVLAWPGYIWMGALFIFGAALLATDMLRVAARISRHCFGTAVPGFLNATISCEIALLIALPASGYALYEARSIRTEQVTVTTDKLTPSARVRIVQISDVHVGLLFREARLESVLRAVAAAKPDVLVSTGDLVDGRLSREDAISRLDRMAAMIAAVPALGGRFAVTGNHEYYAGLDQSLEFTRMAGFTILRNQSAVVPGGIVISGVDDNAWQRMKLPPPAISERQLMSVVPPDKYRLLLKHRPDIDPESDGLFDLQLSGHIHDGQIFPFNLLVRLRHAITCGTTRTARGSLIHVSRGSGTWGPPMRLFAPPEVTVVDIVSSNHH